MRTYFKNSIKRKIFAAAAVLITAAALTVPAVYAENDTSSKEVLEAIAEELGTVPEELMTSEAMTPGDATSDWIAFALIRGGITKGAAGYRTALEDYVSDSYISKGGLDSIRSTEWGRLVMLVRALGADPEHFGADAAGNDIDLLRDGIYNWDRSESLGYQGINGWIYALLAIDCDDHPDPDDAVYTRDIIIRNLLEGQSENGAFSLQKGGADVDLTAMVLTSLSPYKDSQTEYTLSDGSVRTIPGAIDDALLWLSEVQEDNGGYSLEGLNNAESVSQVIIALTSLGIDPEKDERFIKSGNTPLDALASFETEEHLFSHEEGGEGSLLPSEQAAIALESLERMRNGEPAIYDLKRDDNAPSWLAVICRLLISS